MVEAGLRLFWPARPLLYEPDQTLLFRPRPGAVQKFRNPRLYGGRSVEVRINSRGFRGEELASGSVRRVAVYGDSFVEARLTPLERTYCKRLEHALEGRLGGSFEVVNAGVSGYGPDQSALRIESEAGWLRPELAVVVAFAGNDWGDLVRNKLFRVDAEGRAVRNAPVLDAPLRRALGAREGLATARALARAWETVRARTPEDRGTAEWSLRECEREYDDLRARPGHVRNLFLDHYDADLALRPRSEPSAHKLRAMRAVLAYMRSVAEAHRMRLLLVVAPDWRDLCVDCPHRAAHAAHPEYRPTALADALEQGAASAGIACLNLDAAFRPRAAALYHARDGHWNDEGQALAAELTAQRIVVAGLLR